MQTVSLKNYWTGAPSHIPNNVSIDAPLMGNGDLTLSVGIRENGLRFYLSKNDFWRLVSQGDGLSGPRSVGFVDVSIAGFNDATFSAEQLLQNGVTTSVLKKNNQKIEAKSWVSATDNLIFIELKAIDNAVNVAINLSAPENPQSKSGSGEKDIFWLSRAFLDSVDIASEVAVALKIINYSDRNLELKPGEKVVVALAIESKFKSNEPLEFVLNRISGISKKTLSTLMNEHNKWWENYWKKSYVSIDDTVLMKAYYQGLYTMGACSRDQNFLPEFLVGQQQMHWHGMAITI
ncbi:MAG: hypothetical protein IPF54_20720 [Draconibacterium sp.]|nr:hypothetical protein [Draconibacterium sp.]